jgi:hypothetical protein
MTSSRPFASQKPRRTISQRAGTFSRFCSMVWPARTSTSSGLGGVLPIWKAWPPLQSSTSRGPRSTRLRGRRSCQSVTGSCRWSSEEIASQCFMQPPGSPARGADAGSIGGDPEESEVKYLHTMVRVSDLDASLDFRH